MRSALVKPAPDRVARAEHPEPARRRRRRAGRLDAEARREASAPRGREHPPSAIAPRPATSSGRDHGVSSSRRSDCCSASRRADDRAPRVQQIEDPLVVDAVVDARPLAARLDEADPPQRRQMLRRAARVETELSLQRADRTLAVAQQLEDPHPRRMPQHTEQTRLHLMNRA